MTSITPKQETANVDVALQPATRRRWSAFLALGLAIYIVIYAFCEYLVYEHGQRNRLFMVATAPRQSYDIVILGASHAMPFGFDDMNRRLETAVHADIINLAIEGGGPVPAHFILDYFLATHGTNEVVYFLDSFALYSRKWNEERIDDPKLFKRAPFDPALLSVMWNYPSMRGLILGYVSGFYKINDADRLEPDVSDMELTEFNRAYRGNAYLDRQRLSYLYPSTIDRGSFDRYVAEFEDFAASLDRRGIKLIVIRPPLPSRVLKSLSAEADFDMRIREVLSKHRFEFHDFSQVANDDVYFLDTDHLNREGVVNFMDKYLVELLRQGRMPQP